MRQGWRGRGALRHKNWALLGWKLRSHLLGLPRQGEWWLGWFQHSPLTKCLHFGLGVSLFSPPGGWVGDSSTSLREREEFQMGPRKGTVVRRADPADSVTQRCEQPGDDDTSVPLVLLWNLGYGWAYTGSSWSQNNLFSTILRLCCLPSVFSIPKHNSVLAWGFIYLGLLFEYLQTD